MGLARAAIRQPTIGHVLALLPFGAAWVFVSTLFARLCCGYEHLRIGPGGLERSWGVVIGLGRRRVPLEEVRGIAHYTTAANQKGKPVQHGLKVMTWGRPIPFGHGVDPAERLWLTELIQGHLRAFGPGRDFPLMAETAKTPEVLSPSSTLAVPPSDCTIRPTSSGFTRRGSWRAAEVGLLTLANLFWNGIVGLTVLRMVEDCEWPGLLFLSFHMVVGLCMFVFWWAALLAPGRVERWTPGEGGWVARSSFLGMGRSRSVEARRVEMREGSKPWGGLLGGDRPYSLVLVGVCGRDLMTIGDMTEGEARWFGGILCGHIKDSPRPMSMPDPLWDRWVDPA